MLHQIKRIVNTIMNQHKNTYQTFRIAILLFILSAFLLLWGCSVDAPPVHSQGNLPSWVSIAPAQDCSAGCWTATVVFEDVGESGGNHNIYGRMTINGESPAGLPWHVTYPNGDIRVLTKADPEWSDVPIFACFDPDIDTGPYSAYAGDTVAHSAVVRGMGLPQCQHVNFRTVWTWNGGGTPTPSPTPAHRLWLPMVERG